VNVEYPPFVVEQNDRVTEGGVLHGVQSPFLVAAGFDEFGGDDDAPRCAATKFAQETPRERFVQVGTPRGDAGVGAVLQDLDGPLVFEAGGIVGGDHVRAGGPQLLHRRFGFGRFHAAKPGGDHRPE
jgi:hypothetical protein